MTAKTFKLSRLRQRIDAVSMLVLSAAYSSLIFAPPMPGAAGGAATLAPLAQMTTFRGLDAAPRRGDGIAGGGHA